MSLVVLVAVGAALTHLVSKASAIAISPAVGFFGAGAVIGIGAQLNDTPLPVAVAVAMAAVTLGLLRRTSAGR